MGGKGMFYVITRKTLRRGFLIVLLIAFVLWLAWNSFGRDAVFKSGGQLVFWPQIVANRQVTKPAYEQGEGDPITELEPMGHIGEVELRTEWGPESAVIMLGETMIATGDLLDEYLPATPVYTEDLNLAIPATGPLTVSVESPSRRDTFSEFRWERDRSRSRQLETLQDIITDATSSEQQKEAAQGRLVAIMAGSEVEMELEGLLMAQGLPDAVVVLSETGATIMVDSILTEEEAARIGDTVSGMTGMSLEKIRIIDHRS